MDFTPRKVLRDFPSSEPAKLTQQHALNVPANADPTPRKLLRDYPNPTAATAATTLHSHSSENSVNPTPRKLIKGLMSSKETPTRVEDPAKKIIKAFPASETVALSDSRDMSLEDAQFNAEAHRDLIHKTSFRDCFPQIVDGTFTLGQYLVNTTKDLIKGYVTAENGIVEDTREWSSEDAEFNMKTLKELIEKESFQDYVPRIIDGTFTLRPRYSPLEDISKFSPNPNDFVLELPIEDNFSNDVCPEESHSQILSNDVGQPQTDLHSDEFQTTQHENQNSVHPPLPLPSYSPISKRSTPSPSITRQRKSLFVTTQTGDHSSLRSPTHVTPFGSHPSTPIDGSTSSAAVWSISNDSLHRNNSEKKKKGEDLDETVSSSDSDSDSDSEDDSSDVSTDESQSEVSSASLANDHGGRVPFIPPPPTESSWTPSSLPAPPLPPSSSSSDTPMPSLPHSIPILPYKRSNSYANHMAFLDFMDIILHLLNILLWLLILLSIATCLLLVYIRHLLLTSEEESVMMFGIEITPEMIAL